MGLWMIGRKGTLTILLGRNKSLQRGSWKLRVLHQKEPEASVRQEADGDCMISSDIPKRQ
jgi:hypothetical protein